MKKKRNRYDIMYTVFDIIRFILIVSLIVVVINGFVVRKKTVIGPSMYPTLKEDEKVVINVAAAWATSIERFDVVVAKSPTNDEELWVKRVIALPKEKVAYKQGKLYINGKEIAEPFLDNTYMASVVKEKRLQYFTQDFAEITLHEDEYLLVGDNRNDSLDSRNPAVGPFKRSQLQARGVFVYSPLKEARYVLNGN